jgi:hypothetical protein
VRNPPGFGYAGTTDWQWYGMQIEQVDCPPLLGRCSLVLCQAMPKEEVFAPHIALEAINLAAKECIASKVLSRLRS